jgi:radical SAM superfamily enzyme YgiQ (UPF0313 family)
MNHAVIFNIHTFGPRRPAGAYRIASFLREHDWDIEVIEYANRFSIEELQEVARSRITSSTVFFGFSPFLQAWEDKFKKFTAWLKKTYPTVKLIIGSQARPRIEDSNIDYFITGYGEKATLALLQSITGNTSVPVAFDPKYFGSKKVITANESYPSYPMKSLMIKYEDRDYIQPWEWLTIELTRGCKFKCSFCNFPVLGVKGDYSRDAEDFEIQLKDAYDRFGTKNYYITDETFNDYTEKVTKYADVVDRLPWKPYFTAFIRADLLVSRRNEWDELIRMGVFGHFYGVETMNHASGKAIGKGMSPDKLMPGLVNVKEYFLKHGAYRGEISLIAGLPYETPETLQKTFKWIEDNWQGQAANMWPLEIPINPTTDALSFMSANYKDFGYRESSKLYPIFKDPNDHEIVNNETIQHGFSNLNWENDYMDFTEASNITTSWYEKVARKELDLRWSPFAIGDFWDKSMDEFMLMHQYDFDFHDDHIIKSYINKKLNRDNK